MPKVDPSKMPKERQIRQAISEFCAELDMRRVGKAMLPALLGASLTGCPPRALYAGPPADDPRAVEAPKEAQVALYAAPDPRLIDEPQIKPAPSDDVGDLYAAPDPIAEYAAVDPEFDGVKRDDRRLSPTYKPPMMEN
ncbi:hypothetical protein KKF91_05050 [Myxococcota bacterium]|nr:hypothetical protein [Myxococcota bacterium]MBU1429915.1 hypothetical protein [Myxococcota bacterium]MBU1898900.1 hypothetical protein [Myxococcota bacterium]